MTESPCFGGLLRRLLAHRGLDAPSLAGVDGPALQAALEGSTPSLDLLGQLASALGLRLADLCVMAEVPVPAELAPLDDRAGYFAASLVNAAWHLPPRSLGRLLTLARELPQQDRTRPVPAPKSYELYPPGFGAVLLLLLRNRNLGWVSAAKALYLIGGAPPMSGSTVGMLGRERKEITPRLLAACAAVLGVDAGDLAAMGGIELPLENLPVHPCATEMAALIWEARRLTCDQVRYLIDQAKSGHGI